MKQLLLLLLCLICIRSMAQDINRTVNIPALLPASPEAAALGKFGAIPVNNYRGIPSITVPITTITCGEIQLPVSIDYHAGGIKVEEVATRTGLGWALKAGGVITRSQKGLPDESGYQLHGYKARQYATNSLSNTDRNNYLLGIFRGSLDGEPDIFNYNFGNQSGQFFFSDSGLIVTAPRSDLRITSDTSGFIITTGIGIQYYFQKKESTQTDAFCRTSSSGGYSNNQSTTTVTAWFLNKVQDGNGNTVTFHYSPITTSFQTKATDTRNLNITYNSLVCTDPQVTCYNQSVSNTFQLDSIKYPTGKIVFMNDTATRKDEGAGILKSISLYNPFGLLKYYQLYTSYYLTGSNTACSAGYRLRLDSIAEIGSMGTKLPSYKFFYNNTTLPCRLSNDQDYWGYYNAANNNEFVSYRTAQTALLVGANKKTDSVASKAGILEKVVYPTGGYTRYFFESNQYAAFVPEGYDFFNPVQFTALNGDNGNPGDNYHLEFSSNFTVTNGDIPGAIGYLLLKGAISKYSADSAVFADIRISITGPNGYSKNIFNNDTLHLLSGNYTLHASIETEYAGTPYCSFLAKLNKYNYYNDRYVTRLHGGLRIRQIDDYSEYDSLANTRRFVYNNFDGALPDSTSSGNYSGLEVDSTLYEYQAQTCAAPGTGTGCCVYISYNATTNYPLLGLSPTLGYSNVRVIYGPDGQNGKEEFIYTSNKDYQDVVSFSPPFIFVAQNEWKRGLLLSQKTYKKTGNNYLVIAEKKITYDFHLSDTTRKLAQAVRVGKTNGYSAGITGVDTWDLYNLSATIYQLSAEAFNVSSDTSYQYTDNKRLLQVTTFTNSPKNFQVATKTQLNSKGEILKDVHTYPLDYTGNNGFVISMKNKNLISLPMESYSTIKDTAEYVLNGIVRTYKVSGNPDTTYNLVSASPIPINNFTKATVDNANKLVLDSRYQPAINYSRYTPEGMLSQVSTRNNYPNTFIWYYNSYLAAEIKNADSMDVAYSSFETEPVVSGNWTISSTARDSLYSMTGRSSYNMSAGSISKSNLTINKLYIITYWSRNGKLTISGATTTTGTVKTSFGWTLFKETILPYSSTITLTGSGLIDELRLYPKGALMTTYTYLPLVGITSKCDAADVISRYEYDDLNRLIRIRDGRNAIQKSYKYAVNAQ